MNVYTIAVLILAGWQSGYAAACKAVNSGSIPDSASIYYEDSKNKKLLNVLKIRNKY
jgi:hypothetical protein